jgi:hypothetical protein
VVRFVELAREFTTDHPLILLAIAGAVGAWRGSLTQQIGDRTRAARIARVACGLVVAAYAGLVVWYASVEEYYDLAEPTIAAVSWMAHEGASPYHAADAAARYAHIYGPMLFLTHAAAFDLLGPGLRVSKLAGAVAALAALALLALALRRIDPRPRVEAWMAVAAAALLAFGNTSFWTRAEPLLILCAAAALAAGLSRRLSVAVVGLGIATGIAANLKLTGALYVLPVLPLALSRHPHARLRALAGIAGVAGMTAAAPFLLLPAGAASDYWFWLREASENGVRLRLLRPNIEWAFFLAAPLALPLLAACGDRDVDHPQRHERAAVLVLLTAMSLIVVLGAKPGAGPYHLLPFVPLIAWCAAAAAQRSERRWSRTSAGAYALALAAVALIQQGLFVTTVNRMRPMRVGVDVREFARAHPGRTIEMGYAGASGYFGSAPLTYFRPLAVFHDGQYLLDAPAIQEHQFAGIELPQATISAVEHCAVDYWLLPRGEEPFATRNLYPQTGHSRLFPESFVAAFHERYSVTQQTKYFDVYSCRGASK